MRARKRQVYLWQSIAILRKANRPPQYWPEQAVIPLVLLDGNGYNLFTTGTDWNQMVEEVRARVAGPVWAGLWCNHVAYNSHKGATLFPWDDDSGWSLLTENARKLAQACARHQITGVVWDGEIYTATPENNGGKMSRQAWTAGPRLAERALQLRAAFGSLPQAQYVYVGDADALEGWKPYWRAFYRPGDLLLDEAGFLGQPEKRRFARKGVQNLPSVDIADGTLHPELPQGSFWIYPWTEADALTDLSRWSHRWKER